MKLSFYKALALMRELNQDNTLEGFYEGKNFMVQMKGITNHAELLVLDEVGVVQTLTAEMIKKFANKYGIRIRVK